MGTNERRHHPRIGFGLGITIALAVAGPAGAAIFTVTSSADDGAGSLREAVDSANLSSDASNSILFSPMNIGEITLATPLPTITQALTISGVGATPDELVVTGPGTAGTAIYSVGPSTVLTLQDAPLTAGDIELGTAAFIDFDTSVDQLLEEVIRGDGGLRKRGEAELSLTGANTWTGGTEVLEGTLVVAPASLPGNVTLTGDGILAFDEPASGTYAGTIGGGGRLEKRGVGDLTLTGINSYTGGTAVLEGTLLGRSTNIRGNLDISSGAAVELLNDTGVDVTIVDAIRGDGTFRKAGVDRVVLDATNSVASLHVLEGTLTGDVDSLSGDVLIEPGAVLEIASDAPGTIAGDLTGGGDILSAGTAIVDLSGTNTANSLTVVSSRINGLSAASIPANTTVTTPGRISFNLTGDDTYSGLITGTGGVQKRGAGTLVLDQAQTYTGLTQVFSGRLQFATSLAGDVEIEPNGSIAGGGTIAGAVTNEGTILATPATPVRMNALALASTGRLELEIDPAGTPDLVTVDTSAVLGAGVVDVSLLPGSYAPGGQAFTLVNAGTLTGLPTLDSQSLFNDLDLDQVGQDLVLTVTPNGSQFVDFATNRNEESVARSLDAERPTATGDLREVIQAVESAATPADASDAYDALGGEQYAQLTTARLAMAERLDRSLNARLREQGDPLRLDAAAGTSRSSAVPMSGSVGLWLEPFGAFGSIDGQQGADDTTTAAGGFAVGGDGSPLRDVRLGAAFAYGYSSLDYDALAGSADAHHYLGAIYGSWQRGPIRVGLSSRFGYADMSATRRISISTLGRTAKSDFGGLEAGSRLEAGYAVWSRDRLVVEPYVAGSYSWLSHEGFRESGASSVNLEVDRRSWNTASVGAGLRVRTIFRITRDFVWMPELHSEWSQQLADRDRRVDARFQDAAASSFSVRGTELHRNSGTTGVSWVVRSDDGFEARFGYDVGYDTDRVAHAFGVTLNALW